jgi:hypothetical protein
MSTRSHFSSPFETLKKKSVLTWTLHCNQCYFYKKRIGSGTHRVTQNSVGGGQVLVLSIQGNTVPACILLRKNFWNGVPVRSVTKIALIIILNPLNYTHSHNNTLQAEEKQKNTFYVILF